MGVSARRPRSELSNNLEAGAGRTGVVYWNWVDELGDSSVCKTNGHARAQNKEKSVKIMRCVTSRGV